MRRSPRARVLGICLLAIVVTSCSKSVTTVPPTGAAVPDVVGMNATAAESALKASGFEFVITFQRTGPPNPPPLGTVISEKPAAGTHVPAGTKVTIVVYQEL